MKTFQIITGKNCDECNVLKDFLKTRKINYTEWKIEDPKTKEYLLKDPKYLTDYCDIDSCKLHLPAIRLEDTGEYFWKHMFDLDNYYFLEKLLDI